MAEHTQLPWRSQDNGPYRNLVGADETQHHMILIGMIHNKDREFEANVDLIVRAVNHHKELVKALRKVRDDYESGEIVHHSTVGFDAIDAILDKIDGEGN